MPKFLIFRLNNFKLSLIFGKKFLTLTKNVVIFFRYGITSMQAHVQVKQRGLEFVSIMVFQDIFI